MSEPDDGPRVDDQLLHEAAIWFARMRGPNAEESRAQFDAWLARGALHRRAYNRAAEIFAMGKLLADEGGADAAPPSRRRHAPRRTAALAGGALLLVAGSSWFALRPSPDATIAGRDIASRARLQNPVRQFFVTEAGENRSIRLGDGSTVRLAAATRLAVLFTADSRSLDLQQGAARFEVAHEARSFVVKAGGGSVTAHGTVFDVALTNDRRVLVDLLQGSVDVALPVTAGGKQQSQAVRRLKAGESIGFAAVPQVAQAGGPTPDGMPHGETGRAGAQAARDFDNVRLADLIAQANRGASRPIVLASPALGARRVSGRFRIDDPALLADRLSALFNLTVEPQAGAILLK